MTFDLYDPFGYPLTTYIWVSGLSGIAGAIKSISRLNNERHFSWLELCKDILSGGLSGVLAFWICESLSIKDARSALVITIAGIMGAKAWGEFETVFKQILFAVHSKQDNNNEKDSQN